MVQFLSIIFFLVFLKFLLGFSKFLVFLCLSVYAFLESKFKPAFDTHLIFLQFNHPSSYLRGTRSVAGIATGYGLDCPGIESRWGARFSTPVQTNLGAHPTSCTLGTGSFPGIKSGRGVTLTPHPLLVPWSWKGRTIPLPPYGPYCLYRASLPVQGCSLPYLYLLTYKYFSYPTTTQLFLFSCGAAGQ